MSTSIKSRLQAGVQRRRRPGGTNNEKKALLFTFNDAGQNTGTSTSSSQLMWLRTVSEEPRSLPLYLSRTTVTLSKTTNYHWTKYRRYWHTIIVWHYNRILLQKVLKGVVGYVVENDTLPQYIHTSTLQLGT